MQESTQLRTAGVLADKNARLAAARRLIRRKARRDAGRFLAEGAQAVREALASAGVVEELFLTEDSQDRYPDLVRAAGIHGVDVAVISDAAAAGLSQTVTPQGLVAVCRSIDVPLTVSLGGPVRLGAALVEANDPGNVGTIIRAADAAGAESVVLTEDSVDVYNGKTVRATAGSLFHVQVSCDVTAEQVIETARASGMQILATTGGGSVDLDELSDAGQLQHPTLWVFGNEARGLPEQVLEAADERVRVPIYGRAESLNLSAAAAICLYASARAQRRGGS